jgi:ABC-type polysaccharide/polyol phosphate transport system ATPase subunit
MGREVKSVKERTPAIGEWAGVSDHMDFPLRTFSSGMVARLAFATATDEKQKYFLLMKFYLLEMLIFKRNLKPVCMN